MHLEVSPGGNAQSADELPMRRVVLVTNTRSLLSFVQRTMTAPSWTSKSPEITQEFRRRGGAGFAFFPVSLR
jgi:hypothetical protein